MRSKWPWFPDFSSMKRNHCKSTTQNTSWRLTWPSWLHIVQLVITKKTIYLGEGRAISAIDCPSFHRNSIGYGDRCFFLCHNCSRRHVHTCTWCTCTLLLSQHNTCISYTSSTCSSWLALSPSHLSPLSRSIWNSSQLNLICHGTLHSAHTTLLQWGHSDILISSSRINSAEQSAKGQ